MKVEPRREFRSRLEKINKKTIKKMWKAQVIVIKKVEILYFQFVVKD